MVHDSCAYCSLIQYFTESVPFSGNDGSSEQQYGWRRHDITHDWIGDYMIPCDHIGDTIMLQSYQYGDRDARVNAIFTDVFPIKIENVHNHY